MIIHRCIRPLLLTLTLVFCTHVRTYASGIHGSVNYLYWKAQEDGLFIAPRLQHPIVTVPNDFFYFFAEATTYYEQQFRGAQGVRLDLGYEFCNSWDTTCIWTRLADHTVTTLPQTTGFGYVIIDPQVIGINPIAFSNNAQGAWDYNFNTIEWLMSYTYEPCNGLQIAPCAGIMGARIHQCFVASFNDVANVIGGGDSAFNFNVVNLGAGDPALDVGSFQQIARNKFGGVGIACGAMINWRICNHLALIGLGKAALLAGSFDTTGTSMGTLYANGSSQLTSATSSGNIIFNPHRMRPMVQLAAGLSLDDLCIGRGCLSLSLSFEAQYWPNQMMVQPQPEPLAFFGKQIGHDLMFYGLTARCEVAV